jgi:pyruvate/2-oxoglutarate dehydrogenase complex dihydrolipoamide dehydrogenase (E3) component
MSRIASGRAVGVDDVMKPDLCVIGAGSAGLSVAAIAASFGIPVVLIERDRMGGECLNVGCVPSKALIAAAATRHTIEAASRFGIRAGEAPVDFAALHRHIHDVIGAIAPNDSAERFTALGVEVIRAEARFLDARTVEAGGRRVQARRFVLATGSRPSVPPIPGLDRVPYLTNDTIFDLTERPARLLVIGGGPIGVEIAQAYGRLGAAVTVFEAGPRILAREDPEMAAHVERAIREEGIDLRLGAAIDRVEEAGQDIDVVIRAGEGSETIRGSHLLLATGREAAADGLGLEAAGIALDRTGIVVDRGLRTANRRVYAIGDCAGGAAGGYRFTHAANHQAGLVIRSALFRLPVRFDAGAIPRVTFTSPELAVCGLSEAEARERHRRLRILRWPFSENDRAQAERNTRGHVKAIVSPKGRVLGCAIAGPQAGELILPWVLAMAKGLKVQDLAGLVVPYPTLSEVTRRSAVEFLRPSAQNPWLRRLIAVMRRFG